MQLLKYCRQFCLAIGIASVFIASGCTPAKPVSTASEEHGDEHGAWWCAEHGVPEEECAQCDKSLVSKFKSSGDWCEKHNRPDSQCFICHPENFQKFAARYEAKYGEKPEMPKE